MINGYRLPLWAYIVLLVIVTEASYFIGVIPAEGSFGDLTTNQWLGALLPLGLVFGVTAAVRPADPAVVARVVSKDDTTGTPTVVAGEAARYETGSTVSKSLTLSQLVDPHATRSVSPNEGQGS